VLALKVRGRLSPREAVAEDRLEERPAWTYLLFSLGHMVFITQTSCKGNVVDCYSLNVQFISALQFSRR